MLTSSGVTVGRLRVQRGVTTDADPSRSAAVTFGMLDLRPAALPRGATLCVRRLLDPAPGTLSLALRDQSAAAAWQASVERMLADLARDAARPADGPVPAAAVAVLFRDDIELLACLAADWSQPGGSSNWWWQRVAPPPFDGAVARAWLSHVPAIPAVVDRLARRGELQRALAAIDESDVITLAGAVASAYGVSLPLWWRTAARASTGPDAARSDPRTPAFGTTTAPSKLRRSSRPAQVRDPWAGHARELAGMDRSRALLAGMALSLHRSPALARSPAFAAAIADWLRGRPPWEASPIRARYRDVATVPRARPKDPSRPRSEPPASSARQSARRRRVAAALRRPAVPPRRREPTDELVHAPSRPAPAAQPVTPSLETEESAAPPLASSEALETRLGGVFFLLDFAIYLGLYGDFTRPQQPGIELDPWDFLTLLASQLGLRDELATDPLGELLRDLAGRPAGRRPGAEWRPGGDWRVPSDWLDPFAGIAGPWRWSSARDRLRIDHPAGFPVVDVATTRRSTRASAGRALPAASTRRALRRAALPTLPAAGRRAVDRWIARLGAYAGARLRLALGSDHNADLASLLLRLPASVVATFTAVDVEFDLAQLPIAVRAAALDRDPGWVPAARRTVRFHFR